jgi:hypothetical protein
MAVVGTLVMSCPPGSPGCGQPPPDGAFAFWSTFVLAELGVIIVAAAAATLWWRHQRTVAASSPWPEGGYWVSYRRRFKWTALAVLAVTLPLVVLGTPTMAHWLNFFIGFYAFALLVVGLPLSLVVAALPSSRHRSESTVT